MFGFRPRKDAGIITNGRLCRASRVLSAAQGDELMLLELTGGRYFTLDAVGSRIWALLAEPTTFEQIVVAIRREYVIPADVGGDRVERDVAALLHQLHAAGLISVESSALEYAASRRNGSAGAGRHDA